MDVYAILTIVEGVLTIVFGGGWYLNWRAARKKPELENKSLEATTDHELVDAANQLLAEVREEKNNLSTDNEYLRTQNDNLTERNRQLSRELDDAHSDQVECAAFLCRNTTCPLRNPAYGNGRTWFNNRGMEPFQNDRSFEDIAEEKGYSIKRIKRSPAQTESE